MQPKHINCYFSYFLCYVKWTEIASWEWECIIFGKGHTLQGFYPAISRIHFLPVVTIKIQVQHHSLFFYIITASIGNLQIKARRVTIGYRFFFSKKINKNPMFCIKTNFRMHGKTILSGEYNAITDHFAAKQLFAVSHIWAYLHEHRLFLWIQSIQTIEWI